MRQDFPKGDIPLLILTVVADAPRHGYAIAREVERLSADALKLREGSLYSALRVLEHDGFLAGAWEIQGTSPARKIYTITDVGHTEFRKRRMAAAIRAYSEYACGRRQRCKNKTSLMPTRTMSIDG